MHPITTTVIQANIGPEAQSPCGGAFRQLHSTNRSMVSHRIKAADGAAMITVAANPISEAKMYLSQVMYA